MGRNSFGNGVLFFCIFGYLAEVTQVWRIEEYSFYFPSVEGGNQLDEHRDLSKPRELSVCLTRARAEQHLGLLGAGLLSSPP